MSSPTFRAPALLALVCGTAAAVAQPVATLELLGRPPGEGTFDGLGPASDNGRVVSLTRTSSPTPGQITSETWLWRPGFGWARAVRFPSRRVVGLSTDGTIAIVSADDTGPAAWYVRGDRIDLPPLVNVRAMNANGTIAVGRRSSIPTLANALVSEEAVRLVRNGLSVSVETLWTGSTGIAAATAVSADGQSVAGLAYNASFPADPTRSAIPASFAVPRVWIAGQGLIPTPEQPAIEFTAIANNAVSAVGNLSPDSAYQWNRGATIRAFNPRALETTESTAANLICAGMDALGNVAVGSYARTELGGGDLPTLLYSRAGWIWDRSAGLRDLNSYVQVLGITIPDNLVLAPTWISSDGRWIVGTAAQRSSPNGDPAPPTFFRLRVPAFCYANCDNSATPPVLNAADVDCFMRRYMNREAYANCDRATSPPYFTAADFQCFMMQFNAGCPN